MPGRSNSQRSNSESDDSLEVCDISAADKGLPYFSSFIFFFTMSSC